MLKNNKIQFLIISIGFPLLYILLSLSSWNYSLFVEKKQMYYFLFFGGIMLLHWLSLWLVYVFLQKENSNFTEIGLKLTKKGIIRLVFIYFSIAFGLFFLLEYFISISTLDHVNWNKVTSFIPKSTAQRAFYIFAVFTAGFCEEIVYRGYLISKLESFGLNKWLAIIPAGISFVCIHGVYGVSHFWFYFIPAIIFSAIFLLSKRLLPGIIIHLAYNFWAMFAIMQYLK